MSRKRKKTALVHYHPLEWYPPIMNMISFLVDSAITVEVYTNKDKSSAGLDEYSVSSECVTIKRFTPPFSKKSKLRFLNDIFFYFFCFLRLLIYRPTHVFYYETISALPALTYKFLFPKRVQLMVHYHEYVTPEEYQKGMTLVGYAHRLEQLLYPRYTWISQTNEVRLEKFLADNGLTLNPEVHHTLANYPPRFWSTFRRNARTDSMTRLVYVGSLGYDTMYLREVLEWLASKQSEFSLDIYAYNIDERARKALFEASLPNVRYHGGCTYQQLPEVLRRYDVGLVMYKPFSENTVCAVSNKVFEYLLCGLDVWFSVEMEYTHRFVRENVSPKVIAVDFKSLNQLNTAKALATVPADTDLTVYCYEREYSSILSLLS